MALTVVDDARFSGAGIYVGGWNIAPDAYLVRADSWCSAWEALTEAMADRGQLAECDDPDALETDDGVEFVDGHGPRVTLDVVMRTVRPAPRD